jgi:positive regulator of sigma E activity
MEETGIVLEAAAGTALVRMTTSAACDSCSQASLCHPGDGVQRTLTVRDPVGVRAGQAVAVRLPGRGVWAAMGLVYGWPLATLVAGAWAGYRLGGGGDTGEIASAVAALLGLGAGFLVLKALRPLYEHRAMLNPVIVRVEGGAGDGARGVHGG